LELGEDKRKCMQNFESGFGRIQGRDTERRRVECVEENGVKVGERL
jgi:hypothetical protein